MNKDAKEDYDMAEGELIAQGIVRGVLRKRLNRASLKLISFAYS